jgi:DNA repair protein RadC
MPRREHSPYQLAFDFHASSEPSPLPCQAYSVDLAGLGAREEHLGRFVRVVNDEIIVRSPVDAAQYLLQHVYVPFDAFDQEELYVLMLNTKNRITHETMVYRGTVNSVYIRPAELFKEAVRVNAPAILLAHNHPGGSAEPSPEDQRTTAVAVEAGGILGISVLDHFVIGRGVWVSMKEKGLGFST